METRNINLQADETLDFGDGTTATLIEVRGNRVKFLVKRPDGSERVEVIKAPQTRRRRMAPIVLFLSLLLPAPALADQRELSGTDTELRTASAKVLRADFLRQLKDFKEETERAIGRPLPHAWQVLLTTGQWPQWGGKPELPDLRPSKPEKPKPWFAIVLRNPPKPEPVPPPVP